MPCSGNESFVLDTRPSGSLERTFGRCREHLIYRNQTVPAETPDFTDRNGTKLRERVKRTRCCLNLV